MLLVHLQLRCACVLHVIKILILYTDAGAAQLLCTAVLRDIGQESFLTSLFNLKCVGNMGSPEPVPRWHVEVFLPSARHFCLLYVHNSVVPFLKGFKLKVFLFHMLCFRGTNPSVRARHSSCWPVSRSSQFSFKVKSVCKTRSFTVFVCQTLPVGSVSEKMYSSGSGITGLLTLLEICNKVLYQSSYIKLVF